MEIKPIDQTVKNLLETSFYRIPRFQRPYSWDRENVDDFWADAVVAEDPDYFIGSFVLHKSKSNPDTLFVVDGQQRLTTITLLLAAVRDHLDGLAKKDLATGVQKLIERPDINNEQQFVLQSETPYPFLQEYIQKYGAAELPASSGAEEDALKAAFDYLKNQVSSALKAVDDDTTIGATKKEAEKLRKLLTIRDKLLRLKLIAVLLDNEDDAYIIFETLNTRGKDLTVADLVKNYLTRLLKPVNKAVDTARQKWLSILELFDGAGVDIDVNRFLHHAWLSRHQYTTEKKLFREIKRLINKATAKGFLDDLVSDAKLYRWIFEPDSHKWKSNERDVARAIRALNLFRVVQPVPMLLSILRAYGAGVLTLRQAKDILHLMENFHVQFTAVTAQRTGGGTAFMYALAARQLLQAKTSNQAAQVCKGFKGKLEDRVPSLEEFEAGFQEIRYTSDNSKQRNLVKYLLSRIDQSLRKDAAVNYDAMTIEHLAPERPTGNAAIPADTVGLMGNMILVPTDLNNELANKNFDKKVAILRKAKVPVDADIEKATAWTEAEIRARTKALAGLSYSKVFRL